MPKPVCQAENEVDALKEMLKRRPVQEDVLEEMPARPVNSIDSFTGSEVAAALKSGKAFLISRHAIERIIAKLERAETE